MRRLQRQPLSKQESISESFLLLELYAWARQHILITRIPSINNTLERKIDVLADNHDIYSFRGDKVVIIDSRWQDPLFSIIRNVFY